MHHVAVLALEDQGTPEGPCGRRLVQPTPGPLRLLPKFEVVDPVHAAICYRRAWELYLEAGRVEPSDDDMAAISELARLVPANQLDPRYRIDV